jgi:hypothetical protein
MRISHIYQPVMLQVLLKNGGTATTEEVAKVVLSRIYAGPSARFGHLAFEGQGAFSSQF